MPRREQLLRQVLRALAGVAPDADLASLRPDQAFRDQIELDSLDFLNFVLALEKHLRIEVPESDYPKLATLDGCVAYLGGVRERSGASRVSR
jgi:acyl carrier protein